MMRHLIRNTVLAIAVILICASAIFPPGENLRRGRDLAGGVSLIYAVDVPEGADAGTTIQQTIDVLKDRVDPQGTLEISFVRQGRNRIEVQMPLPSDSVKELRRKYLDHIERVSERALRADELGRVMRLPAGDRASAIEELARGGEERLSLLREAADAYDASLEARAAFEEAQAALEAAREAEPDAADGPADEEDDAEPSARVQELQTRADELLNAAGEAAEAYERARADALASTIEGEELRSAVELSDRPVVLFDPEKDENIELPSPRAQALERLREQHVGVDEDIDEALRLYEEYEAKRKGLDDPQDLIRLLSGAGVLDFRIAVSAEDLREVSQSREQEMRLAFRDRGPRSATGDMRWFPLDDLKYWYNDARELRALQSNPEGFFKSRGLIVEPRDGQYYMLLWDTPGKRMLSSASDDWGLARAYQSIDSQSGRPNIAFEMDTRGAVRLGELTGDHIGDQMAVVLDDSVITAPTLQGRISRNGQISGSFSPSDLDYLAKTMSAGSLQAQLGEEPISMSSLGPELGQDNLNAGFTASVLALVAVAVFMVIYYFGHGLIAVFALLSNAVIILGAMALNRNSFTLPGIAGIVLTFGMAVDANVLIFERIREELGEGSDLRTAVRLAYQKVLSTILDANITNFIVCLVLLYTATQEIKGFAITLMIGIVATLFSTLYVSRIIYTWLLDKAKLKKMRQLPEAVPFIQRALSPNINWLKLRPLFIVFSAGFIGLGVAMIAIQGEEMLDNEFRGGTKVTAQLAEEVGYKSRQEIEDRLAELPEGQRLTEPEILPENPQPDGVTSDRFIIKTVDPDRVSVQERVSRALSDWLDAQPAIEFAGSEADAAEAPAYPILDGSLGSSIGRPEIRNDVAEFLGGVAIELDSLDPQVPRKDLVARIDETLRKTDFSDMLRQDWELVVTDGTNDAVRSAVFVASDPDVGYFDDEERWRNEVVAPNWELVVAAIAQSSDFVGAESFSAQVAATRQAQAIVAVVLSLMFVMVYIWFRFGSLRYSLAAITALVHDVLAVVGLIAAAELLYLHAEWLAIPLMIEPFKIDLGLIAALLTIIGYSLNDTIVILDRVRENRGRLDYASADVVNLSINQTVSRTIITSGTTLVAVLTMYVQGGTGIRSFTYALLCGVVVGTYSSIAVAAPLVYSRKGDRQAEARASAGAIASTPDAA